MSPSTQIGLSSGRPAPLWIGARWSGLAVFVLLLVWLVFEPSRALRVFWYALIPILPAIFFVNPALWRGVCPLATLNEFGNRLGTQRAVSPPTRLVLNLTGLSLFYLLVPARHFVFNQQGVLLAITAAAVGGCAVMLGTMFTVRSAFCNALCPILPVELVYGMAPLVPMERSRCATCSVCTPRGCYDLAQRKTLAQRLGPARRTAQWLATPYGAFFAALPGFVIGYNHVNDGAWSTAGLVYTVVLGWSLASYLLIATLVLALRVPSWRALPLLAAGAGGIYYWYAGSAIVMQFGAPEWLGVGVRTVGIAIPALWLARTLVSSSSSTTNH